MSDIKAGFVGLGAMGRPMAGHLSRAGLLASAWTRTPANTRAVAVELGLDEPASLAELAARCNVIALCVPADAHVLANVEEIATNAQPGTNVIDHTTVSSVTAVQACERMRVAGGEFIDAPVSGGVEGARNGKLSITDGPFAETKEQLAGFYLIDAKDLNEALQVAGGIPAARVGSVEVRPVRQLNLSTQ